MAMSGRTVHIVRGLERSGWDAGRVCISMYVGVGQSTRCVMGLCAWGFKVVGMYLYVWGVCAWTRLGYWYCM